MILIPVELDTYNPNAPPSEAQSCVRSRIFKELEMWDVFTKERDRLKG